MKLDILDGLKDDELVAVKARADELLLAHDRERKDTALAEATATLAKAGISLKDLARVRRIRPRAQTYRSGRQYQHPTNKALVWNAKGKKPGWLTALEAEGGKGVEVVNG